MISVYDCLVCRQEGTALQFPPEIGHIRFLLCSFLINPYPANVENMVNS
jgi:hypothetical protein